MTLTDEHLLEISGFAELFYSAKQICIIMQLTDFDWKSAMKDTSCPFYLAYQHGFLKSEAEVRKSEVTLAKQGSTPAQENVRKYISDAKKDNE